ncbi:MAG TPA: HEAT repeat domain-containing protein [Gemmatimonadales bacterium]
MKLSWSESGADARATIVAATAAAVIITFQLAGKATRDALFLSTFGVGALPSMVILAAILSGTLALLLSRVMARTRPARLVPRLFLLSALLLAAEWALNAEAPRATAVLLFLHVTAFGAILVSGFWAMVNERFDPRTARRSIGQITAGASIGGLLGGILPDRVGSAMAVSAMLPILMLLQLLGGVLVVGIQRGADPEDGARTDGAIPETMLPATRVLWHSSYLLGLASLVILTSTAEGVLDYVFKARATAAAPNGQELLRFFAVFYTATALIGVFIQITALRWLLGRLGVARSASVLPAGVTLGAIGAFFVPGLTPILLARGTEVVLRSSLFRAGYELLFTPVAPHDKRATKLLLDVGAARVGDVVGGILILLAIAIARPGTGHILLALAALLSAGALWVARRLHLGYVTALEGSLQRRAGHLPDPVADDAGALLQTVGGFDLSGIRTRLAVSTGSTYVAEPPAPATTGPVPTPLETAIRSGNAELVRAALARGTTRDQTEHIIDLLAWDAVAADAIRALAAMPTDTAGVLLQHLLDPDEDFAIRRRLVGVLAGYRTTQAFKGLFEALGDKRFEVRYRAGLALSRMADDIPGLQVDSERVFAVMLREMAVERSVWESRQLIDAAPESSSPMETDLIRDRVSRSLEHLFALLSLVLPRATLRLAFQALHTDDAHLRGTALEYLETVLPEQVWRKLWPLIETGEVPSRHPRASADALRELMKSQETISLALSEIRRAVKEKAGS